MLTARLRLLQWSDRLAGPPLLRAVRPGASGLRTPNPGAPVPAVAVRRLLVIRPGGIGDAVLTWPMLRALAGCYPGAAIDVLAESRNAGVYAGGGPLARVYRYDDEPWQTWRTLRRNAYDVVLDTEQYHHGSTLLANALRPTFLCGFDTLGRSRLQTHSAGYAEDVYEALSFLRLAEVLTGRTLPFDADRPFIDVPREAADWAVARLPPAGAGAVVAIAPVAGGVYRLWPAERYAALARWLIDRERCVVLLGGADAAAAAGAITAMLGSPRLLNLAGRTTLPETAAVLARAELALGADTGVMHLAYGVGTSTVALFGPGLQRKWAPPGARHRVVRKGLACSPCTRFGRVPPCPHRVACMTDIQVSDVTVAVESLWAGK
jgi:ADP-heptose:LPS heptosyltransferase